MGEAFNLPPIMRLPPETLDQIMSCIDLHHDLMSFALTSRASANLVIPRHNEYRVIRIRHAMPHMWAHLARRADLARNIREVHICERGDYTATDHFPSSLVEGPAGIAAEDMEEGNRVKNLCHALRHMDRLEVFTWSSTLSPGVPPTMRVTHEGNIFLALSRITSLTCLGLSGRFGLGVYTMDLQGAAYPLWKISNLQSLSLRGDTWIKPAHAAHVCAMLKRSPGLQYLDLPMEFTRLPECRFPQLKHLKLPLHSGAIPTIDASRVEFIEAHPTIEDLSWHPIGPVSVSSEILPSLRRLNTTRQFFRTLDGSNRSRNIECLHVPALDTHILRTLHNIHKGSVQKLILYHFDDLLSIRHLAALFPALVWLSIPHYYSPHDGPTAFKLEDWLDTLSCFAKLEVFRGGGLWTAVDMDKGRMHNAILELVQLCPKLRQLDHCQFYEKRHDYKRIVIFRETDSSEVEHVRYEVQKPPARRWFDPMDGIFD